MKFKFVICEIVEITRNVNFRIQKNVYASFAFQWILYVKLDWIFMKLILLIALWISK